MSCTCSSILSIFSSDDGISTRGDDEEVRDHGESSRKER
jgi:hypothetical protein